MWQIETELLTKVWSITSPFVAAGITGWLTYFFGIRKVRNEFLIKERLEAFKRLQASIVNLQLFCDAEAAEQSGADIRLSIEDLPDGVRRSPLEHLQSLTSALNSIKIFLSRRARIEVASLIDAVGSAANVELFKCQDPELVGATGDLYRELSRKAEDCIDVLYNEL